MRKALLKHLWQAISLMVIVSAQLAASVLVLAADSNDAEYTANFLESFVTEEARQGVAVDADFFYSIDNRRITKYSKDLGELEKTWRGAASLSAFESAISHLDSAVVFEGKLYAAHSNYPDWPMSSSIEIWNTETLEHVSSHSFGIQRGSFTWLDRYEGYWWGAFANYDLVQNGQQRPYGETENTQIVKMDDDFNILAHWLFPESLLEKFKPMSNSGGSWGNDGLLYITGHDRPEIYALQLPSEKTELVWQATIQMPELAGQGIAWDRSTNEERNLWAILRNERKVLKFYVPIINLPRSGR